MSESFLYALTANKIDAAPRRIKKILLTSLVTNAGFNNTGFSLVSNT